LVDDPKIGSASDQATRQNLVQTI